MSVESDMPRVSLGLPVYNGERFLRACLDSILNQTLADFELIVCDNASTDSTPAILSDYACKDPRIAVHRALQNRGAAANFNWTFELSRGKYFKWCAADDILRPSYLDVCVAALDRQPDAVMAYSGAVDIDEKGEIIGEIYDNRAPLQFDSGLPHVRFRDMVCSNHSCVAVFGVGRRSTFSATRLIGPYVGSDRTFLVEMGLRGRVVRVGDDLLLHREHPGRSVNEIPDLHQRARWFDTKATGRVFPSWRLMSEYMQALSASDIGLTEKARCITQLVRWIKWGHWRDLIADVRYNVSGPVETPST